MSRAFASHSGRSGNLKVVGSNLDLAIFESWSSQTNYFKIDTCHSLAWHSALLGQGKPCWLNVRIMQLSGIAGHAVGSLVFQ